MKVRGYAAMQAQAQMTPWEFERRELGANDVSLDIKYSGICHSDIHQVREEWGPGSLPNGSRPRNRRNRFADW